MLINKAFAHLRTMAAPMRALATVAMLAAIWAVVHASGGSSTVFPHLFYVPIIMIATSGRPTAALLAAGAAGILAGPLMPLDVERGLAQSASNWLPRLGFFVLIGQIVSWMSDRTYPSVRATLDHYRGQRLLRTALQRREFQLHFQPIVDVSTGNIVSAEALLRWERPGHGLVPPNDFIPLAESTGMIVDIGRWVLDTAVRQVASWRQELGYGDFTVSVNIAAQQLDGSRLVADVDRVLAGAAVPPRALQLEVTETGLLRDLDHAAEVLGRLRIMGVRVCVDDFGVGQSSLAYLQRLPLDGLKIDRSFVAAMGQPNAASLVGGILGLAAALEVEATAEGVEAAAQAATLHELGCRFAQGYHFGRPMPAADLTLLLREGQRTRTLRSSALFI